MLIFVSFYMRRNGWTNHNEKLCQNIGNKCAVFKMMHNKCEEYYIHQFRKYTTWLHCITFLGAVLSAIDEYIDQRWLQITIKIVSLLSAFVARWYTSNDIDSHIKLHKLASSEYLAIYNDVTFTFSDIRDHRPEGREYTKNLLSKCNDLYVSSVTINRQIIQDFIKKYGDNDIARPVIADEIKKIEIHHKEDERDESSTPTPPPQDNPGLKMPFKMFRMPTNKNFAEGANVTGPPVISEAYQQTPVDNIGHVVTNADMQYPSPPNQRHVVPIHNNLSSGEESDSSIDLDRIRESVKRTPSL